MNLPSKESDDDFDWTYTRGETASVGTGPLVDHTTRTKEGQLAINQSDKCVVIIRLKYDVMFFTSILSRKTHREPKKVNWKWVKTTIECNFHCSL